MKLKALGSALVLTLTCAFASHAFALSDSDKEAVRSLSNDAALDFEQLRYASARDKFTRAYGIAKVPKLAVWLARSEEKLGHLVAASELYREAAGLEKNELWKGDTQQQAKDEAERELSRLSPRIPKLTVLLEGAQPSEVELSIDNASVASGLIGVERPLDPGPHEIVARRGSSSERKSLTLAEGDMQSVTLSFASPNVAVPAAAEQASSTPAETAPAPKARDQAQRTAGWIGIGVGGAGLALGAVTGILVGTKYSDLKDKCGSDHVCDPAQGDDVSSYQSLRTVSTVGFVAGGVLLATGVTLLLTSPKAESATVGVWLSPRGAGLRGAF